MDASRSRAGLGRFLDEADVEHRRPIGFVLPADRTIRRSTVREAILLDPDGHRIFISTPAIRPQPHSTSPNVWPYGHSAEAAPKQ